MIIEFLEDVTPSNPNRPPYCKGDAITLEEFRQNFSKEHEETLLKEGSIKKLEDFGKKADNSDILTLLSEEEREKNYLDLGEAQGVWYFGFNVKGKEAVVTSRGEVFRNTIDFWKGKQIGENEINRLFEYSGYMGDIAPVISNKTILKYYQRDKKGKLVNPKKLYKSIKAKILYYMDFAGEDEIADVLTSWIMATYCYPLFYWFPHVLINAPSSSGKSKCAFILTQLCFRGYDLGASAGVTPAQVFRTIEGNRGTILFDEYEKVEKNEAQQLVNQILNASATKDAYVIRTEQIEKKWKAWKFPIFCPKIVCNITGINPTSLSRFIAFKWLKTTSDKGKKKPYRQKDKESFIPLREELYLFTLENWKSIKETFDRLECPELNNRDEDNWLPLLAIAKFIDSCKGEEVKAEENIKKYISNYKSVEVETNDNTEQFLRILADNLPEERQLISPKDIAEWSDMAGLLNYLKSPAHWIGKKLTLYKFKKSRSGAKRSYLISKADVEAIIKTYYGTEETSHNDTNDINVINDTNDTKSDVSDVNDVIPKLKEEVV